MSFGTNDINSIIDCSDDDVLRTDNEDVEDNEDIVNQILDELGDDNDNDNNLNDVYNTNTFNTKEVDLCNFNNMDNNHTHNHNDINHNHIDNQSYNNNVYNNDYNNNSMFSSRLNDDINFKEHIKQKKPSNKKKNEINKKKNEDMNNSWCSFIPSNILSNILLYKDYILIIIICLITNNPLVYKQMMNISIFNTEKKLNIFACLFQTLLFVIIYFIINFIISFI
jgi:hypothetical protein